MRVRLMMILGALFVAPQPSIVVTQTAPPAETRRVTILYDAFGQPSDLQRDWGFAALVEYNGSRILFDTGNNASVFEHNVRRLGVDLSQLDAVVISHRHGDHTTGLEYVLKRNPGVKIFAPREGAFFKGGMPPGFLERHPDLPQSLRYFGGKAPASWQSGTPWPQGNFEIVTRTTEIVPGFHLLTTRSQKQGTLEMNEVSLAIRTAKGLSVVVGCSHPGVEKILEQAAGIESRLYTVTGGFHLVLTPPDEVRRVADVLRDTLKVERVAPGHCTSELGFAVFLERFGDRFDHAGVGASIPLP